jgi:hypothetical protein
MNNIQCIYISGLLPLALAYLDRQANTECPSSPNHCLIPNRGDFPLRPDILFRLGIRFESGRLFVGSRVDLGGLALCASNCIALCSKSAIGTKISISSHYLITPVHCGKNEARFVVNCCRGRCGDCQALPKTERGQRDSGRKFSSRFITLFYCTNLGVQVIAASIITQMEDDCSCRRRFETSALLGKY